MANNNPLLDLLGIRLPIIQAPMAGVSSPAMAAAVTEAGALGSIGVGATDAAGARTMVAAVRERSTGPLNVNVFCHKPATPNRAVEAAWIERLRPEFEALGATPPPALTEIYRSFVEDDDILALLLDVRPSVVSFHFGLPREAAMRALRDLGIILLASATSLAEARIAASAGIHAIIAQGWEAGGHRGVFDPDGPDDQTGIMALTRLLSREIDRPVIAAGGIMDGAGIAAVLKLGASAAQLGTAFIATDEESGRCGLSRGARQRRRQSYGDDPRHLGATGAESRQPLHRLRHRCAGGSNSRLSDRLRPWKGAPRRRQGEGRIWLRRAMGGPGRAAYPANARGPTGGDPRRRTRTGFLTGYC